VEDNLQGTSLLVDNQVVGREARSRDIEAPSSGVAGDGRVKLSGVVTGTVNIVWRNIEGNSLDGVVDVTEREVCDLDSLRSGSSERAKNGRHGDDRETHLVFGGVWVLGL